MNLPSGSAIPGALVQALAIATAALPAGTTVYFGAVLPYTTPLTLQITEITGDQKVAELGTQYRREETFSLVCTLSVYQGGAPMPDFSPMLTDLMTQFNVLALAIGNNPTLNGTVRFAEVGNFLIDPQTDENGFSAVSLDFSIRCQQRVTSLT
jgi:hypothetical protein